MQRFFSQHFHVYSKSPCFVNFGTIKEFEIVFLIVMNDFRFIDCINDDKPATGLVFVATEPSFDEVHYCRAKTLFGKFNIRPQATDQNSGIAAKINRQGSCLETLFAEEIPNEQNFISKILFTLVLFGVFGLLEKTFSVFPLKRWYGSYCH